MFEYAALVDAPVQRFTGIVTGSDPDSELVTVSVVTPMSPVAVAVVEAPVVLVAAVADTIEAPAPPALPAPLVAVPPTAVRTTASIARPSPGPGQAPARAPAPAPAPSFVPALVGAAIAGLTAMWWLRRESHDRHR